MSLTGMTAVIGPLWGVHYRQGLCKESQCIYERLSSIAPSEGIMIFGVCVALGVSCVRLSSHFLLCFLFFVTPYMLRSIFDLPPMTILEPPALLLSSFPLPRRTFACTRNAVRASIRALDDIMIGADLLLWLVRNIAVAEICLPLLDCLMFFCCLSSLLSAYVFPVVIVF